MFDVSNPENPLLVGYYFSNAEPAYFEFRYPYLYCSEKWYLSVYDCSEALTVETISLNTPNVSSLNAVYPNPFNQRTVARYNVGSPGIINLSLYDLSGKLVNVFIPNEYSRVGQYEHSIDARGFPSGNFVLVFRSHTSTESVVLTHVK